MLMRMSQATTKTAGVVVTGDVGVVGLQKLVRLVQIPETALQELILLPMPDSLLHFLPCNLHRRRQAGVLVS